MAKDLGLALRLGLVEALMSSVMVTKLLRSDWGQESLGLQLR